MARHLSGRKSETFVDRQKREQAIEAALETFKAYDDLAKLDTLAEINARLGDNITSAELRNEMEKLAGYDQRFEDEEEEDMCGFRYDSLLPPIVVGYDEEEVDKELDFGPNFFEGIQNCEADEVDLFASRLVSLLSEAGCEIKLDAVSLAEECKQAFLLQFFGEGWNKALSSCLSDTVIPADYGADDAQDLVDHAAMDHTSIMDHAEEMALSIKREMAPTLDSDDDSDLEGDNRCAELMLLASLMSTQRACHQAACTSSSQARAAGSKCNG